MVEKLVAEELSQFCETKGKLHKKQIKSRKYYSTIDAATLIIHKVHKIWDTKQVASVLLINIKRAFNYIS